jgi:lambda family phage minor tail protein L
MNEHVHKEMFEMEPSTLIILYELILKDLSDGQTEKRYRFHGGENGYNKSIKYGYPTLGSQGNFEYFYVPCRAEGFDYSADGLPRPTITFDNTDSFFSLKTRYFKDFIGYELIRIKTFVKFLHGSNFPNDVNPFGSPTEASFPYEEYVINTKVVENAEIISFELNSKLEKEGGIVPARKIVYNVCQWKYRSEYGCGYQGGPKTDKDGNPLTHTNSFSSISEWSSEATYSKGTAVKIGSSAAKYQYYVCQQNGTTTHPEDGKVRWTQDICPKNIAGCRARFQEGDDNGLPFGGFPGSWPK